MRTPKSVLYIAMSLDGFIAKPNDDLSFLSIVAKLGEDYGYSEFIKAVETIILGRKTYDWVIKEAGELSYPDQKVYVISNSIKKNKDNVNFYSGNLNELITKLKSENQKDIFIDGGAELVNNLMKDNLIDEFIISVIPIFLGNGVRLFNEGIPEKRLKLIYVKNFDTGLVQLKYELA
ncbi:MAG: dihydrofolate reductase [Ignavibacteriae bacterium]|nr:dihydrofolate reductase [Ignavibacteriota bacterium]